MDVLLGFRAPGTRDDRKHTTSAAMAVCKGDPPLAETLPPKTTYTPLNIIIRLSGPTGSPIFTRPILSGSPENDPDPPGSPQDPPQDPPPPALQKLKLSVVKERGERREERGEGKEERGEWREQRGERR